MKDSETTVDSASTVDSTPTVRLWTAQMPIVLDTLEKTGIYHVKREFVEKKYGEVAWIFREGYSFYNETAPQYVKRPEGAESGIWCYRKARWAGANVGSYLLCLEVPRDQCVFFDLRTWNRILNLHYVPKDREDQKRFDAELKRQGLKSTEPIFNTSFYPLLKREIRQSWQRLYSSVDTCDDGYLEAGLWELRPEWIVRKIKVEGEFTPWHDDSDDE